MVNSVTQTKPAYLSLYLSICYILLLGEIQDKICLVSSILLNIPESQPHTDFYCTYTEIITFENTKNTLLDSLCIDSLLYFQAAAV